MGQPVVRDFRRSVRGVEIKREVRSIFTRTSHSLKITFSAWALSRLSSRLHALAECGTAAVWVGRSAEIFRRQECADYFEGVGLPRRLVGSRTNEAWKANSDSSLVTFGSVQALERQLEDGFRLDGAGATEFLVHVVESEA
jgi:hypothetical protein